MQTQQWFPSGDEVCSVVMTWICWPASSVAVMTSLLYWANMSTDSSPWKLSKNSICSYSLSWLYARRATELNIPDPAAPRQMKIRGGRSWSTNSSWLCSSTFFRYLCFAKVFIFVTTFYVYSLHFNTNIYTFYSKSLKTSLLL